MHLEPSGSVLQSFRDGAAPALVAQTPTICCIVPAYRAADSIVDVIAGALQYAQRVIVVDDGCPMRSGHVAASAYHGDSRVRVVFRDCNGGVGAAVKTGIAAALESGEDVIVKLDADGQMDPAFMESIRRAFAKDASLVCVKGNRFFDSEIIELMPRTRLFGNAVLSLCVKFASGYWNTIDPTNGYLGFNSKLLSLLHWDQFADSYFFEMSVLCELGIKRLPILELEMPTIYTSAPSSLSIARVMWEFPPRLLRKMMRRLFMQYFLFDINLGTLYLVFGTLLCLFGVVFGGWQWTVGLTTHVGRPTGTVMLAVLPFLMGFQLLLNALMYDVQFSQKTYHELLPGPHRDFSR
jgi:hypothetical protein